MWKKVVAQTVVLNVAEGMSIRFKHLLLLSLRQSCPGLLVLAVLFTGGCGVVSKQTLDIETDPKDAFVYVNGKFIGNSPADVRVNRDVPHRVEIRKVGFVSQKVMVYPAMTGGDGPYVKFGPLRESGFYQSLEPNPVSVELVYEGLAEYGEVLTEEQADSLIQQIQQEREAGELTDGEAALALSQVQSRMR